MHTGRCMRMRAGAGMHLQAPSLMAALYRERCHSRKDSGKPKPEMRLQNSQSLRPLCPAMNLRSACARMSTCHTLVPQFCSKWPLLVLNRHACRRHEQGVSREQQTGLERQGRGGVHARTHIMVMVSQPAPKPAAPRSHAV